MINAKGTIPAPTFGGGASSLVTELLGDDAIIRRTLAEIRPRKMKEVARICFKHWLNRPTYCSSSAVSRTTPTSSRRSALADALREHFSKHGATPLYVVIRRGGLNSCGMGAMRDTFDGLGLLPHFRLDSDMSRVINYAQAADAWMNRRREQVAAKLTFPERQCIGELQPPRA